MEFKLVCAALVLQTLASLLLQPLALAGCGADGNKVPIPKPPPIPPVVVPPRVSGTDTSMLAKATATSGNEVLYPDGKFPKIISWAYNLEDMLSISRSRNQPYVIYFCTEAIGKVTGEGAGVLEQYKKANDGKSPNPTPFDNEMVVQWFYATGLTKFAKIVVNDKSKEVVAQYGASVDQMMICAPDGEKLAEWAGVNCNDAAVVGFLRNDFKAKWESWKLHNDGMQAIEADEAGVQFVNNPFLLNVWRFSPKLYSGGQPDSDDSYKALKTLGVKTIISVEGQPSNQEKAAAFGMSVVHIPTGYNGVSASKALILARAVRDLPGPVYMHCACGIVRSPAAACAASITLGELTPENAVRALKSAGADEQYKGVYETIGGMKPASKEQLDAVKVEFKTEAEVSTTTQVMNHVSLTWKKFDKVSKQQFAGNDARDLASALLGNFASLSFNQESTDYGDDYKKLLAGSEKVTKEFIEAFDARTKDDAGVARLNTAYQRIQSSCTQCHQQFRDRTKPK